MTEPVAPPAGVPAPNQPAPVVPGVPGQGPGQPGPVSNTDPAPDAKLMSEEAARYRTQLRAAEAELAQLKAAGATDAEKALAAAKAEGAKEFQTKWLASQRENAAITLLATKNVVAIDLALRALDLSNVDVDLTTGVVDTAALGRAVDATLQRYPMLVGGQPQLPGVGYANGADQRRVTAGQVVGSTPAEKEQERLNELARYALGSGA